MPKEIRMAHGPYVDEWGLYFLLPLSRGLEAKISPEDVERVSQWNWCASRESRGTKDYAIRWARVDGKSCKIRLHRFIKDLPPGSVRPDVVVDHIGDDGLDCRQGRLEIITQEENMLRSKGWKKKGMKCEPSL